jgi:hypothetical protein
MLLQYSYFCSLAFIASSFFSPTLRSIFLVSGLVLWLLDWRNSKRLDLSSLDLFFIAYILVNLVLTLIHGDVITSWFKTLFTSYLQWFWFKSLFFNTTVIKTQKWFPWTIMAAASVLSLIVLLQLIGLIPHLHSGYGVLSQPFTSSGLLLISLFLSLAYREMVSGQRSTVNGVVLPFTVHHLPLTALLLLQAVAIIALGQLSVWVGLLIGFLVYFILTKKLTLKSFLISVLILSLSLFAITILSPRVARKLQRLTSVEHVLQSKSMQDRLQLWQQNTSAWLEKPVFGINKVIPYGKLTHVHNIYLQQLVEGGLLKFIAWLSFYLAIGVYLIKNLNYGLASYFAAYLAISIEGLLENWWGDGEVLSLFLVMVILACSCVADKSKDSMIK